MKRIVVVVLILAITASVAFSRGKSEGAAPEKKPEIVIMTSDGRNSYAKIVKDDDALYQEMSRLFGKADVKYDFLEHARYSELLTLRFASGDLADVIQVAGIRAPQNPTAIDNKVFVPLNDLFDKYGPNIRKIIPDKVFKSPLLSEPDGTIYGIPKLRALPATRVVYTRGDWLERLGVDEPETPDDYLALFKLIKENDMDGDGDTTDEVPFGVRERLNYSELFFGYFGAFPGAWQVIDGKMTPDIINPKMKDAIAFWTKLYSNGYVNEDLFTRSGGDWVAQIRAGEIGVWTHDAQNMATTWNVMRFSDPNARLAVMRAPRRSDGKTPLVPDNPGFSRINVITRAAESPEVTVEFFNWLHSDDEAKERLFSFGAEGVHHTVENGKAVWDPEAAVNTDNQALGFYQALLPAHKDNRMSPLLVELNPMKESLLLGKKIAPDNVFDNPGMHMPLMEAQELRPELGPRAGTLFLDMFAKVVTGKDELNTAWDAYVAEWRKRGGNELIDQATTWYAEFTKN